MSEWEYKPTATYTESEWNSMRQHCVYLFWMDSLCMYVGRSKHGLSRPLDPKHDIYQHEKFSYNRVEIQTCSDVDEMNGLEEHLIRKFDPVINIRHRITIHKSARISYKTKEHRSLESKYHPKRVERYKD